MTRPLSTQYPLLLVLLALWLASCSTQQPTPPVDWPQHQQQLQQLTHYQYQARGAVIYRTTNRTLYARFHWQQHAANHFQLRLLNPLGQSVLTMIYRDGCLCLRDQAGQTQRGQKAEKQLQSLIGLAIPLPLLAHWLIGLPNPGDQFQLNQQQRLWQLKPATLTKPPLQLTYLSYHPPASPLQPQLVQERRVLRQPALPAQLLLHCGAAHITLKINHWILP